MSQANVTLEVARPADLPAFKQALQEAFSAPVIEQFGGLADGAIPSDADLDRSIGAPGAVVLHIASDGRNVGGAVVTIDGHRHHNSLDLLFIVPGVHGRGLGFKAWSAIELRFPDTVCWQTHTPYFDRRNIHFYVNKCGFRIVEFFNRHHPEPAKPGLADLLGGMFRFEKYR
ncbi:gcn5-related n-acetyltransferase [Sphingomonas panacis]|uniref:Gcn5-related n-acetyltransferase n=2 Tax=Sphingomonas panacis TaxID=1560345 RepID=A0A1B3ZGE2_9SPHN|nr:gcn5-related n-acetyltransferase [Sphingomonas panacis]